VKQKSHPIKGVPREAELKVNALKGLLQMRISEKKV
jgi:hypothetical protein